MLRAVGHHNPVPGPAGTKATQPLGTGLTVAAHAGLALVTQHLAQQVSVLRQALKGLGQRQGFVAEHGHVMRQIDRHLTRFRLGAAVDGLGRAHIGAVAHPGNGQALALQNRVRAADGASGHPQAVRQTALRWQLFAHGQLPVDDGLGQVFGNGLVFGLATITQTGG